MRLSDFLEALKDSPSDYETLVKLVPALLSKARSFRRRADTADVDDLLMASICGVLEVMRSHTSTPSLSYLYVSGWRAMIQEARKMLWNGRWETAGERASTPLEENATPGRGREHMEAVAELVLIERRADSFDWEVGLRTWLEEHTLQETAKALGSSTTSLFRARERLRPS